MKYGVELDGICFPDAKYTRLTAPILFQDLRTIADLRHPSPDIPHGGEDPCFLTGGHTLWRGDGAQLRDRLATTFDHDNAAVRSLSY
jgi:hypothetical protein